VCVFLAVRREYPTEEGTQLGMLCINYHHSECATHTFLDRVRHGPRNGGWKGRYR